VRELPEVKAAAAAHTVPYTANRSVSNYESGGRSVQYELDEVTDGFADVMRLSLVRGRWFSREDDGAGYHPVVINQNMARCLFGSEDPIGKTLSSDVLDVQKPQKRVIGVVTAFRKSGEYSGPGNFAFFRANLDDPDTRPPANILIRLRPGTGREFEERLMAKLQGTVREWSFTVQPLVEMREFFLRAFLAPAIAAGLVAAFLMIMVGLGLTGVLWQNVTQRTKEIGVRRAKGATERDILVQIMGELCVITSLGVALGALIAVQVPLLGLLTSVSGKVYGMSFAISLVALYALTLLCGLYPSHLASRIQPAEALRYE